LTKGLTKGDALSLVLSLTKGDALSLVLSLTKGLTKGRSAKGLYDN
jgi:hypothetical protein